MSSKPLAAPLIAQRKLDAAQLDLTVPKSLPIADKLQALNEALTSHPVTIVAGETGSGKTTQLPKLLLALGYGVDGTIAHTQPRRLAARTVATRIATEVGTTLGASVGYAVRFSEQYSDRTLVKLMTDGLLLAEVQSDRRLAQYDAIIIDEAHERSLNIDFLLGLLKRLLRNRPKLKIVVTSATIDVERFSKYFDNAPIVEVSGRGYPVTIRHLDPAVEVDEPLVEAVTQVLAEPVKGGARDILVFQTGEREIFENSRILRDHFGDQLEVLPLYARLRRSDQDRVFRPGNRRRLVLATNVAETSLTVPNIGFVIDPGQARLNRYSYRSKLQRLPIEAISQASAEQRAGRCGRVAPGLAMRLYSEEDFAARPHFTDAEIHRVNLASVVLQMKTLGLGDPARFGFIDPPDPRAIRDAHKLLEELGALNGDRLSEVGRQIAKLPIDPRLARMLIAGAKNGALSELLIITSALTIQDPRERPQDERGAADAKHEQWQDEQSDFFTWLNLWRWLQNLRDNHSRNAERRALKEHFLNAGRVREWRELHRQLALACKALKLRVNQVDAPRSAVHRAVLAGSLSQIGLHDAKGHYEGTRSSKFRIFPGSSLTGTPKWVVAAEIAETARVYARTVGEVHPRWIEELSSHLAKRSQSNPRWSQQRAEAQCSERVTLYGLALVENRTAALARFDRDLARKLLVEEGLVDGRMPSKLTRKLKFLEQNLALIKSVRDLEARGRRRDLLVDRAVLADFYEQRLPAPVVDGTTLVKWWDQAASDARAKLYMSKADALAQTSPDLNDANYPGKVTMNGTDFRLTYRFAPGSQDDGLCVQVPLGLLQAAVPEAMVWLVPGYLAPLIDGYLRNLPKHVRKKLVPIADRVQPLTDYLSDPKRFRNGRFTTALGDAVDALYSVRVQEADWQPEKISPELRPAWRVLDGKKRTIGQDRDFAALLQKHANPDTASNQAVIPKPERLSAFPQSGLPASIHHKTPDGPLLLYPCLVDHQDAIELTYASSPGEADTFNQRGYPRAALLWMGSAVRYFKRELKKQTTLTLHYAPIGDAASLEDQVLLRCARECYFADGELPQTQPEFEARCQANRGAFADHFDRLILALSGALAERFELMKSIGGFTSPAFAHAVADVEAHVADLLNAHTLVTTPTAILEDLPRFIAADHYRLKNLQGKIERDKALTKQLTESKARIDAIAQHRLAETQTVEALLLAWEQVRVGVFAQKLVRKGEASAKKLNAQLESVERAIGIR